MNILLMAVRNVFKNKKRSALNVLTFFFSVFVILYGMGFLKGQFDQMFEKVIELKTGHFKIYNKNYPEKKLLVPLDIAIDDPEAVIREAMKVKGVKAASARITAAGMISNTKKKINVLITGVDYSREKDILTLYDKASGGVGKGTAQVLVGQKLAEMLSVKEEDNMLLFSQTSQDANNLVDVDVSGIYSVGYTFMEKSMVFIDYGFAGRFLDMNGRATEIIIRAERTSLVPSIKAELKKVIGGKFPGLVVYDWQEESPELIETARLKYASFTGMTSVLIFLAVFIIMNTLTMSVFERIPEIGTMRAIGMRPGSIMTLFMMEGVILSVLGVLVGFVLSAPVIIYFNVHGIVLPAEVTQGFDIPMDNVLKAVNSPSDYFVAAVVSITAGILGALLPAVRASKVNIVSSLKKGVR